MKDNGFFVLSLDFEMLWGALCCSNAVYDSIKMCVKNESIIIDRLLHLLNKYKIHATWAVVGAIALNNTDEFLKKLDYVIRYDNEKIDVNDFKLLLAGNEQYYFSPELIQRISETEGQIIGTHTFTHIYTNNITKLNEILDKEISNSLETLDSYTDNIRSIVFPKNQVCTDNNMLLKHGISIVRGLPLHWRQGSGVIDRLFRFIDLYFPSFTRNCYDKKTCYENGIYNIRASRFFRPYSTKLYLLEKLKVYKIKKEMTAAARNSKIYHLWFHPHNMGTNIDENFRQLESVFHHYQKLTQNYKYLSVSMEECVLKIK